MRRALSLLFLVSSLGATGCARGVAPATSAGRATCEAGDATYYADSLSGHRTANGEKYDPRAKTAAHRTAKLGSWVRVTWGDRETRVRVNDRGPFARGGVVDLSRAAAEELGMVRAGRVRVTVCPVDG